jgi:hypothetical protein
MLVVRECDRVAALTLRALDVQLEERGAEAFHLLLHGGTHVEGRDDGTEPPGSRDRLQAGDTGAEHEDASGRDRPRGGGEHRHELRQVVGRDQRALVARDRALGGERIHRLRAGDARNRVHREGSDAPLGERAYEVAVDEGLQKGDEDLPVPEPGHLAVGRLLHLRHRVDSGERVPHDLRATLLVGLVEEPGCRSCTRLDEGLHSCLGETLGRIGHEGDSPLARSGLLGDADLHAARSLRCECGRMAP